MKKWILLLLAVSAATPAFAEELDFQEAARIVIQSGGRKKPLDTYAAESMQAISGRRSLKDPETGRQISAVEAVLSMWFDGRDWKSFPLVLVSDAKFRDALGLPGRERLFSFSALMQNPRLREMHQAVQAKHARQDALNPTEKEAETILSRLEMLSQIIGKQTMTIVPNPTSVKGDWLTPLASGAAYGAHAGITTAFKKMSETYLARDAAGFVVASREFRQVLSQLAPGIYPPFSSVERELHYNRVHPFRWAWVLYVAAFFVLLVPGARWAGLALFGGGLALHIYGFVLRSWIAGHAPVTNMYESVVWVSLGVAAFALVFDLIYRARVYLLTAAPLAVFGLIVADMLPSVLNPSIGPLPPVLRDNFWLVTHVLTITLGYAAFALAMGLGHVILAVYLIKPQASVQKSQFHHLLYRVLQIGVLLLAAGTILGGVWANYSWGRFWGWDPKETWALIALLLYIFALHGRIAGWWGNFGLSVAAAVCFNGVLMAWYGVNFVLGKGLHSYGFGGGGAQWIGALVSVDLLFIGYCVFKQSRRSSSAQPLPHGQQTTARALS